MLEAGGKKYLVVILSSKGSLPSSAYLMQMDYDLNYFLVGG